MSFKPICLYPFGTLKSGLVNFPDGSDESHNIFVDYLRENTPYDFEYTFYSQENPEDRNMLVASGNQYDIISWPSDAGFDLLKLQQDNYLTELDDYLQFAPKATAQVSKDIWPAVTIDGKIVSLPMPNASVWCLTTQCPKRLVKVLMARYI